MAHRGFNVHQHHSIARICTEYVADEKQANEADRGIWGGHFMEPKD